MNRKLALKDNKYIYIFNDLVHLKRVLFFLKTKIVIKNNFYVLLTNEYKNDELTGFCKNDDSKGIEFINIKKEKFFTLNSFLKKDNINIILDRNLLEKEFLLASSLYRKENFSIIFLEHNLYFQWEHKFNHRTGYERRNLLNSLKTKTIYKLLFRVYFSNLKWRALNRRVNPLEIINYGIVPLVDKIYLYSDSSYKFLLKNKRISKIEKTIIKYPHQLLPFKPKEADSFNTCIYSVGSYKSNDQKVIDRQTEYIKFLINFLKTKFSSKDLEITIKFKSKEIEKANIIFSKYQDSIIKITDKEIKNSFDLAIVPIDSFTVIEYLQRGDDFFVYNLFPNLGPIGQLAKRKNIREIIK